MDDDQREKIRQLNETYDLIAEELDNKLAAPRGFMSDLLHEDDWSFVIKGQALIEGAVSRMLALALDERLRPIFKRLPLNSGNGKMAFAKALEMLGDEERAFVRELSELRNKLAHDVSYVNWKLDDHVQGLEPAARQRLFGLLSMGVDDDKRAEWLLFVKDNPKLAMYSRIILVVTQALQAGDFAEIERTEGAHALRQMISGELVPPRNDD